MNYSGLLVYGLKVDRNDLIDEVKDNKDFVYYSAAKSNNFAYIGTGVSCERSEGVAESTVFKLLSQKDTIAKNISYALGGVSEDIVKAKMKFYLVRISC